MVDYQLWHNCLERSWYDLLLILSLLLNYSFYSLCKIWIYRIMDRILLA